MKKYLIALTLFFATTFINGQNNWWFFDDDREAPAAPTSLFVGGLQNKDSLTWTDPTALDFDSVRIYRETWYGSGVYSWQYSVAKGVQVKIDSALTPDSVYRYKLYAKDKSGNISSASSTAFDTVKPILYAIDLDGSTEYASKTTPLNLDLNGAEMVVKDSNSTFESTDTTDWTGAGTHSADTSSTYKQAGSYSMKIVGNYGDTLQNNGDFGAGIESWTLEAGWTISGGMANFNGGTSVNCYNTTDKTMSILNEAYEVTFTVSNYVAGGVRIRLGNGGNYGTTRSANGTYTETILIANGVNSNKLYFYSVGASQLSIDNVTLKQSSGDTTTNNISLAYTQFEPIVAGNKYTIEYWGTAVGSKGSNLVPDSASSFSTYPGGGLTYYSLTNGTTVWSTADSSLILKWDGVSVALQIYKSSLLTVGNTYYITFRAKADSNRNYGFDYLGNGSSGEAQYTYLKTNPNLTTSWQNYSGYYKPTGSTTFALGNFYSAKTLDDSVYIDNIVVKLITKPTITAKIGSKSWTSDTLSIIPGVFENVVYNFQATTAEVNTPIKFYLSQADTVYIDNFSITQAYDLMVNVWINNNISGTDYICVYGVPGGGAADNNRGYGIYGDGTNVYTIIKGGLGGNTTTEQTAVSNGSWTLINVKADRIGNLTISKNGVAETPSSITSIGKITSTSTFFIGAYLSALLKYGGQIAETQIVRYPDITTETTWTPSAIYYRSKAGFNFPTSYTGGTIVASYRWIPTDNTVLMNDESASANDLTGTNLTTADSVLLLGY